ncbi:MAG: DUF7010 family protein [Bacillota bacterium]
MENINELRNQLSIKSKNGLPFLIAAIIIWLIILIIYSSPLSIIRKNIFTFYSTGLMFPMSIFIAKIINAEWKTNDNPLGKLGLYLNLAQIMYFPLLFWAFSKNPEYMIIFFSVITGAHFFPYGWFYNTKAYFIIAPITSITVMLLGWNIINKNLWQIPLVMIFLFIILSCWLYIDYKKKTTN